MKEPKAVLDARAVIAQYEADKANGRLCRNCGHRERDHFSQGCQDGWCESNCFKFVPGGPTHG